MAEWKLRSEEKTLFDSVEDSYYLANINKSRPRQYKKIYVCVNPQKTTARFIEDSEDIGGYQYSWVSYRDETIDNYSQFLEHLKKEGYTKVFNKF